MFLPPNAPAGAKFSIVAGRWTVPSFAPAHADDRPYFCDSWIGIDGWGGSDVLQAGVECEANIAPLVGINRSIHAWWEWYPGPQWSITNLDFSAGDAVICTISATSDTSANIVLVNDTTNKYTAFGVTAPKDKDTKLVGNCAEWIVERPNSASGYLQLASYSPVTFQEAWAGTNLPGSDAVRDPSEGAPIFMTGDDGNFVSVATVAYRQVNCSFVGVPPWIIFLVSRFWARFVDWFAVS